MGPRKDEKKHYQRGQAPIHMYIYTKLLVAPIGRMRDEKDEDRLPNIEVKTPKNQ